MDNIYTMYLKNNKNMSMDKKNIYNKFNPYEKYYKYIKYVNNYIFKTLSI